MYTQQEQAEAIRAIARNYGISEELSPRGYNLLQVLELVNVKKSDITCLGRCTNGGICQRHIAKDDAIKGLLGVMRVVFDSFIQGQHLETCLERNFIHLLCTQDHKDGEQAAACMEGRIDAVEIFRKAHGIGSSREDSHDSYAASMQTPEPGAEDLPSSIDWKAAYEVLTAKYRTLEKEKGSAEQEVVCLEIETKSLQQEKAGMDKDKKRVQETLRKAKEEKAALEIENCVLQMENEELKSKTDSVRETLGSLRLQLDGEGSDGEGYGTPRTPAEGRSAKAPSTTSKNPFDFTFQSSRNDAMKRPLATPRDSVVPSSPIGIREADAKQIVGGANGLSTEGGI